MYNRIIMNQIVSLEEFAQKPIEELSKIFETSEAGLSESEAKRRALKFGLNEFRTKKRLRPFSIFLSKFKNPVLLLLIGAAIVSAYLGSRFNSYVILAMVLGSAVIDFFNTYRSEQTAALLEAKVKVTASVFRNGKIEERPLQALVPGDVIALEAGDLVPADAILIESKDVFVNEAVLTGEAFPIEKNSAAPEERLVWMGTSIVSGVGRAVVALTGKRTKIGGIAAKIEETEPVTDFDKNLTAFSLFIFRLTILLIASIFIINIIYPRTSGIVETFLFAVAIAVGLTPELLPMIVTTNLAKSALRMSKEGVIVKRLSAIHNLGGMDVLCTDKTGTLTEDRIELFKYVDGLGKEDEAVLKWGYISSVHLTGIRGTLDHAIQDFKKIDVSEWEKIDEIPFDFERRRDSIVVGRGSESVLITKGAPEDIFHVSGFYGEEGKEFRGDLRKKVEAEYRALSSDGFRTLGVAIKKEKKKDGPYTMDDEFGMTFLGFLAFLDPPKKTAKATLKRMEAYGISIKIVTGDFHLVAEKIARELELPIHGILTADEIEKLSDAELKQKVEQVNLFTRVTPDQKERIIQALRENGHVVGYLGDGVNDVLSLRGADVGISVDNAVDVAKETADIILLKKGLHEIIEGVIEGRKTYANIFKYLMMALSSNFGNMVSMPVASIFLPFLPMTATQIILNNFLYDISQFTIPFDRVSEEFLVKAKKFNIKFLREFMIVFGPLSSFFDLITFLFLYFVLGLRGAGFQTGWFLESIATQALVVNIIRTRKGLFESPPSPLLIFGSLGIVVVAWLMPFTFFRALFGFATPSVWELVALLGIVIAYLLSVELIKRYFYRRWGYLMEK